MIVIAYYAPNPPTPTPRAWRQSAATFSQYRERLVEEKHALTGEILSHLGLQWVAPSHGASPR